MTAPVAASAAEHPTRTDCDKPSSDLLNRLAPARTYRGTILTAMLVLRWNAAARMTRYI